MLVSVIIMLHCSQVLYGTLTEKSGIDKDTTLELTPVISAKDIILSLFDVDRDLRTTLEGGEKILRTKRQAGAGKFTEAATMGQTKVFRLWLQMFITNPVADSYVGGAHPLHHEVPKAIVFLFKRRIMEFFFPPVGIPDKTQ